jgi:hypothetical protein
MSKESESYKALTSVVVLTTLVSSFVLSKRLEDCVPRENEHQKNSRLAVLYLSGFALVLALYKAFGASFPRLGLDKFKIPAEALYNAMALMVVILNLYYISTVKSDLCTNATLNDMVANKNLMVTVLVLCAVSLIMILKRGLWWAGVLVGKKVQPPQGGSL